MRIRFLIIFYFIGQSACFAQMASKLIIQNRKGKCVYAIAEGKRAKIITRTLYDDRKYKGILKIVSDTTLLIDSTLINIDSIWKIARFPKSKQVIGHSMAVIGSGIIAGGIALILKNNPDPWIAAFNAFIGSSIVSAGSVCVIIGEKLAFGNLKRIRFRQKFAITKE